MASFEFTNAGIVESSAPGDAVADPEAIIFDGLARIIGPPVPPETQKRSGAAPRTDTKQNSKITPKTVIQAAKQRVREIRADLKRLQVLQIELTQLEALLAAAEKAKPGRTH